MSEAQVEQSTPNQNTELQRRLEQLEHKYANLSARLEKAETLLSQLVSIIGKSERAFQPRVFAILGQFFGKMSGQMLGATEPAKETPAFHFERVNGDTVKENNNSVIVRRTETGYDFAMVGTPDVVQNDGTEAFVKWFDEHPEFFGEENEIVVNVMVDSNLVRKQEHDDQSS